MLLPSIILTIVVAFLVTTLIALIRRDEAETSGLVSERLDINDWLKVVGAGAFFGAMNFLASTPALAPWVFVAAMWTFVYMARWWRDYGSEIREAIPFVLIALLLLFVSLAAAWGAAAAFETTAAPFVVIAVLAAILTVAYVIGDMVLFRREMR